MPKVSRIPDEARPVPGFDGLFWATPCGRIFVSRFGEGGKGPGELSQNRVGVKQAYRAVKSRHTGGGRRMLLVHRLVALAFVPAVSGLNEVNHKNGVKHDNRAENLEWCDRSYNIRHAYESGLCIRGADRWNAILTDAMAIEIKRELARTGWRRGWNSMMARRYGIAPSAISFLVRGKTWKHVHA